MKKFECIAAAILVALVVWSAPADAKKKKKNIGIISGQVVDRNGGILTEVEVILIGVGADETSPSMTDAKGEFAIEIMDPDGEYQLSLLKEGYAPYQVAVPLEAGSETSLVFTLLSQREADKQKAIKAFNRGAAAFRAKDYPTATEAFEEAKSLDPELAPPLLGLADIYLAAHENRLAADAIDTYLTLVPDDPQGLRIAYEAYRSLDDPARLAVLEDKLLELGDGGNLAIDHHNEGARAVQRQDYEAAVPAFRRALELDPKLAATRSTLATVLFNLERYDEALAEIDALLEIEPANAQGHRVRFLVFDGRNETEKAWEAFDDYAALEANGAAQLAHQRADQDFRNGSKATAEAALLRILTVAPEFARAHYTLGLVYASSDPPKAKKHLEKFIELAPDDPEVESARSMIGYM